MRCYKTILFTALLIAPATCFPQFSPSTTVRGSRYAGVTSATTISADARLVIVPVQVADRAGTPVNNLKASSFQVFDNKIEQPIVSFGADDSPCSIGIVLDFSGSMAGKSGIGAAALRQLLETANSKDEFRLLTVSTRPEEISGFTRNSADLQNALVLARPAGATALIDTIRVALMRMRAAQNHRKALLVVSDGMDNHSRTTSSELMRLIEESDVQVYTIGVENRNPWEKPVELMQEKNGLDLLRTLSARSGGLNWTAADANEMPEIVARLSQAVREEYVIGYRPPAGPASSQWRSIEVKVDQHQLHVSARTGYYSR